MRSRPLAMLVSLLSVVLLAVLGLGWTRPIATAQSGPAATHAPPPAPVPDQPAAPEGPGGVPLVFIENVGQFDAQARFQVRRGNRTIHVADGAVWFSIVERGEGGEDVGQGVHLKLSFPGANPRPRLEPFDRLTTRVSFFRGGDPAQWHTDVPAWGGVRYVDLYPGVDLELTSEEGRWTWRVVGRDARCAISDVRLRVEGAEALALEGDSLRLTTALGDLVLPLLEAVGADGAPLNAGHPAVKGAEVLAPFSAPGSHSGSPGVQNDESFYGTFLGGDGQDIGNDVAIDGDGDAYIAGWTASSDFPATAGAFTATLAGGGDAFVAKIHPAGQGASDLVYATYIGGSAGDYARAIAVDGDENVAITGWSNIDFPDTAGAFQNCDAGGAFVTRLNASGTGLLYSGCIVGVNAVGHDVALDGAGRAYVSGQTGASLPTTGGAFQTTHGGGAFDAFLALVSADGSTLSYATYLGGDGNECTGTERGCTLALHGDAVYLAGDTESPGFPTTAGAYDRTCGTDGTCDEEVFRIRDAFLVKLDPASAGASDLLYGTFIGHGGGDAAAGVAVDGSGHAYLTGITASTGFPTTSGAYDRTFNGGHDDAFVLKLNPAGGGSSDLLYATFLGGAGPGDRGRDIAVDGEGYIYVVGTNGSADFPTTPNGYDTDVDDVFVMKLDPAGSGQDDLVYGTFLGGDAGTEIGYALAVDGDSVLVTGKTTSTDFPTSEGGYDRSHNGGNHDVFLVRLAIDEGPGPTPTPSPSPSPTPAPGPADFYSTFLGAEGQDIGNDVAIDGDGDAYIAGSTASSDFPATAGAFDATLAGGGDAFVAKIHPAGQGASDLVYATYIGGSAGDYARAVAVDGDENVFITGWSNLLFPDTVGAFQNCDAGGAFVTKLNATGSALLYSGCIVGVNAVGHDIALDGAGLAYVSGQTGTNLPTTGGAFQTTYGGGAWDAFLAKVSADGSTLSYATYVGGDGNECTGTEKGCTLALGGDGVYLAGDTESPDFPTTAGAYDRTCGTDGTCDDAVYRIRDAFLVKLDPAGAGASDLLYGTFIGHSGGDAAAGVAVDSSGHAYLTGITASTGFPITSGAYDRDFNGGHDDAFLLKLDPVGAGGSDLLYATFLGGGGPGDKGRDIALDGEGYVYVVGTNGSADFPTTPGGYDRDPDDIFVLKMDPAGHGADDLAYGTFLGGDAGNEIGYALAVDGSGNVYLTGKTTSTDFPTSEGAYDRTHNGGNHDAFLVRMSAQVVWHHVYLPVIVRR